MAPDAATNPTPGGMIPVPQQIYLAEAKARYEAALNADIGLVERLVWFWSNHFCVSADKGPMRPLCGAYEREAIRPHVLGKFSDMLLAVETHPAMLLYLDNARSIGPNSIAGLRRGKGLNENLAREIMELHTLGVRTGYTQADVTNFAKVITGWTVVPPRHDPERGGEFWFNERMHEPGAQTRDRQGLSRRWLRARPRRAGDAGASSGDGEAHRDQARAPFRRRRAAAGTRRHTGKALPRQRRRPHAEITKALMTAPEAWQAPRSKLKKPGEWTMAAMRAGGLGLQDVRARREHAEFAR